MAITLPVGKIGLGGSGGSNAWRISFNEDDGAITVGFGTILYNGKWLTTNDLESGTESSGFNDTQVFTNPLGQFVYLQIFNATSQPDEESEDLKIKIDITTSFDGPNDMNENAPLVEFIPLAFLDDEGVVTDLRTTFIINNFSFLA